jgi:hypothetical protein
MALTARTSRYVNATYRHKVRHKFRGLSTLLSLPADAFGEIFANENPVLKR